MLSKRFYFFSLCFYFLMSVLCAEYQIGSTDKVLIDSSRNNRQIPIEILYPADYNGEDAPLAEPEGVGYPVIVFAHGRLMEWSAYSNIYELLVPEGYVVIYPKTEMNFNPDPEEFSLDLVFSANSILEEIFFDGYIIDQKCVMGHSMGGSVAFLAATDTTFSALCTFAMGMTSPSPLETAPNVFVPTIIFGGSDDFLTPSETYQIPPYENLSSEIKTFISINGANHCQYADENLMCDNYEDNFPEPGITREVQHQIMGEYLVPWLDYILRNNQNSGYSFLNLLENSENIAYLSELFIVENQEQFSDYNKIVNVYPNPISLTELKHRSNLINFEIDIKDTSLIKIGIYNIKGQLIRLLSKYQIKQNQKIFSWDGKKNDSDYVDSGIYFAKVSRGNEVVSNCRLVVIK